MPRIDARDLPIARVLRLNIVCEDCGRRSSLGRHEVAREQIRRGLTTPEALATYLKCLLCAERGGSGRNVSISVRYVGEAGEAALLGLPATRRGRDTAQSATAPHCTKASSGRSRSLGSGVLRDP